MFSGKLGMTLEQMENEIETMRKFDKYLQEHIAGYSLICHQFALEQSADWLESMGVDSCEFIKRMDIYKTERQ